LQVGGSREIVVGEVPALHIKSSLVNERLHVDAKGPNALGRMSGRQGSVEETLVALPVSGLATSISADRGVVGRARLTASRRAHFLPEGAGLNHEERKAVAPHWLIRFEVNSKLRTLWVESR
jgi:hypothetical protein